MNIGGNMKWCFAQFGWLLLLTSLAVEPSLKTVVPVDEYGVRIFGAVPPVGVHPRVLLSPEDIEPWRDQVVQTRKGREFFSKRYQSKLIDQLAAIEEASSNEQIAGEFTAPGPVHDLLYATLDAVFHQDQERALYVGRAVTNFARVVLARSKGLGAGATSNGWVATTSNQDRTWGNITDNIGNVKGLTGIPAGLTTLWYRGGTSFALSYDFLYNDLTPQQRDICRKALSVATKDLITHGMGFPKGRANSNHYPYHGEYGAMLLAIEGEEGFHSDRYKMFTQMLHDWFDGSLYATGGSNEDGYVANTALREATFSMIAMARRGDNLFHHPGYQAYWKWLVLSLPPGETGGRTVEYTCNAVAPYESMPTLSLWASPANPLVNYYFRQYKGADYSKNNNWQYGDMSTLFAVDYQQTPELPLDISKLGLPLTAHFPRQGLTIARSDWSDRALYLNFLCRPDAWIDKHECVDRGRFVLSAMGRDWIVARNFRHFDRADGQTLMHIDGKSQLPSRAGRAIVPPGRMVAHVDTDALAGGAMDLKYAYDWQWSNEFNKPGEGWEPETTGLKELGWVWPTQLEPPALFGADDPADRKYGYNGLNFWRKPAVGVRYAYRTCLLVRGKHPYAVVLDDFRKDDQPHRYESFLQLGEGVNLAENAGGVWEMTSVSSNDRLLLWPAGSSDASVTTDKLVVVDTKSKKELLAPRVVVGRTAVTSDLKLILTPVPAGQTPPKLVYDSAVQKASLNWVDQADELLFAQDQNGRTTCKLVRDGREIAVMP